MLGSAVVSVNDVVDPPTVATFDVPRYTSYPATPTLSVDAAHVTVTDVALFATAATLEEH